MSPFFKELFINRSFSFYLPATSLNALGSSLFEIAATVYVYNESNNDPKSIAFFMIVLLLPSIILPPFGGVIGDKIPKKLVITISNILIGIFALFMFLFPFTTYIYFLSFLVSSIRILSGPSRGSYIPEIVEENYILTANSRLQSGTSITTIIGMLISGLVVAKLDAVYGFLIYAICIFIASFLTILTKPSTINEEESSINTDKKNLLGNLIKGFVKLIDVKDALRVTILVGVISGVSGIINVLYLVFVTEVLGMEESFYSVLMVIEAVGLFIGSLIVKHLQNKLGYLPLLSLCTIVDGICIGLHYSIDSMFSFLFLGLLTGTVGAQISILSNSILQKTTEASSRASVFGSFQMIIGIFSIPGLFIGGLIQSNENVRILFGISGLIITLIGLYYFTKSYFNKNKINNNVDKSSISNSNG
ncbi:MFS transporter [Bacillus sp. AFS040349]|uniref:MFS transporter n=1 Tax=Bacillus sp. AFS040349 TaxID=2033502 RepID=UPI00159BBCC1|nr:MFS transporter [Bacillus sp. AFS040349]